MSKIFSAPKMPRASLIQPAPAVTDKSDNAMTEIADTTDQSDEERISAILRRNRGRSGTIATSFRGTLSDTAQNSSSAATGKTLLGE